MGEHIWLVRNPEGRVIGASVCSADGAISDASFSGKFSKTEFFAFIRAMKHDGLTRSNGYILTREALAPTLPAGQREPLPTGTAGVTRYDGEPQANGSLCCATLTVHGRDYICGEKADHHGEHISPVSHMKWCDNRHPTTPTRGSDE